MRRENHKILKREEKAENISSGKFLEANLGIHKGV